MLSLHSLALVSRELCRRLIRRGHEVSLAAAEPGPGVPALPDDPLLARHVGRPLPRPADVHVRPVGELARPRSIPPTAAAAGAPLPPPVGIPTDASMLQATMDAEQALADHRARADDCEIGARG